MKATRLVSRHPWIVALLLVCFLGLGLVADGAVLPLHFTLEKVGETYKPWRKSGLMVAWEIQRYTQGIPDSEVESGTLVLRRGRYRAESGQGANRQVRLFDNSEGGILSGGQFSTMPSQAQASLPEGVFLRSGGSLLELMEGYGVDSRVGSPGRMATGNEEIPFKAVTRYGVPAGPDDFSSPQVWIEPHTFNIHRIIAQEGQSLLQVDYYGHGQVSNDIPWLPREIRVSSGGRMLYQATLKSALGDKPTDAMLDLGILAKEGSP